MKNVTSEERIIKEKGNRFKYKISLIILILALVFVGVFATYAFFQTPGGNNQNQSVSVQAGNMELIFSDGNPGFSKELEFGGSAEKTFTIKNNGTVDAVAKINWKNLVNDYLEESLTYSLSYTDEESNTTEVVTNKNVPRSETPTILELANGISILAGKTYTLTLTITLNYLETDQTADLNAQFSSEFSIEEGTTKKPIIETGKATEVLLSRINDESITDYNSGNKGEMFTFSHDATEQTEALTDYRYIGNEPNNYINFNNETWRVIGVFTVEGENGEKEQRIKIIRDATIDLIAWDSNGVNEWPTSSLSILLNSGAYYNRSISEEKLCGGIGDLKACDFTTIGLTNTAKNQISPAKWYLGGSSTDQNLGGPDYYNFERGTTVYTGRSTNVVANVGLMYPSDYIYTYANEFISENPELSWLFLDYVQWTITPSLYDNDDTGDFSYAFNVSSGSIHDSNFEGVANVDFAVTPCVYLRSDIEITGGDGSSVENAYTLSVPTI